VFRVSSSSLILAGLVSVSAAALAADMPVTKASGEPGDGKTVAYKGDPLPLAGTGVVKVGEPLPAAIVRGKDLKPVNLAEIKGKVRIISVVPSLDTPVCEEQTHRLSEKTGGIDKKVELVTVSMDLPFAQSRFSKEAKINNVTFLSDYNGSEFGNNNGLLIKPLHLLTRTVIVTDKDNIVRYVQVVPELTSLPDLSEAVKVAESLL
jgi:thioredoxin-dependent peroxiredoxin